ncbi:ribosome recycling factor family protein [Vibrio sp. FNV 38]|nr:ribosome recycling factor family protein [Vibrio sp. FNV 38]
MSQTLITVSLPSFIHRLDRQHVDLAKQLCSEHNCSLKRVRRSRNWQMTGPAPSIQRILETYIEQAGQQHCFFTKKVSEVLSQHQDKLEPLEKKLVRILQSNPTMTLQELMSTTRCSILQARHARFSLDEDL